MRRKKQKSLCVYVKPRRFLLPLLCLFLLSPAAVVFRSIAVMAVYSESNKAESLLKKENISLHIPGGMKTLKKDWFPFVMTYSADSGFRTFTKRNSLSLTILYNFPAFSELHGCSNLYNRESPYYNSFYGAYLVQDRTGIPYGFLKEQDGALVPYPEEISEVPRYDFFDLVLSEFGLTKEQAVFEFSVSSLTKNCSYAGEEGFFCLDATLLVNGAFHKSNGFTPSYLQYGSPDFHFRQTYSFDTAETAALAPVKMYGRIYGKYLKEKNTSLFFYIVTVDREVLEDCDKELLSKSSLQY